MPALSDKAKALIDYCRENERLYPQPDNWNQLWKLLPKRTQLATGGWNPPYPLLLATWSTIPGMEKMFRLQSHVRWADQNGAIDAIDMYLRNLTEDE